MIAKRDEAGRSDQAPGPEAYRAIYLNSPDGILFSAPDGRVFSANPAACEILRMSEDEICAKGRQGLADLDDPRWPSMLAERARTGAVRGVARMIRGDGEIIDVEMSAQIFREANGEQRTCTIIRDVTERLAMEKELRDLALTDDLTRLHNRRSFVTVGSHILELADRQRSSANVMFIDVDNMKDLNDLHGHACGDTGLQAVAQALNLALRRADVIARIGGDEFAALAIGLSDGDRETIEDRIREYLSAPSVVAAVGRPLEVSIGWAERMPGQSATVRELLLDADRAMYGAKAAKRPSRRLTL